MGIEEKDERRQERRLLTSAMKIDSSVSCSALQPYSRQLVERGNDDKVPSPETTEEAVAGAVAVLPEPAVESVRRCFVLAFSASGMLSPVSLFALFSCFDMRTLDYGLWLINLFFFSFYLFDFSILHRFRFYPSLFINLRFSISFRIWRTRSPSNLPFLRSQLLPSKNIISRSSE